MGRHHRALSVGLIALGLAGCCPAPRLVEVPTPVPVPGPVETVAVPAALLDCGEQPERLVSGITGGELRRLALAWQGYGECWKERAAEIAALGETDGS